MWAQPYIKLLTTVEIITLVNENIPNSASEINVNLQIYTPLKDIDLEPIIKHLTIQKSKLEMEIMKPEIMLGDEKFVANAPKAVVVQNQTTLHEAKVKFDKIQKESGEIN